MNARAHRRFKPQMNADKHGFMLKDARTGKGRGAARGHLDGTTERVRFVLTRCVPIKLKAPALNAKDGVIAIEELQLAYESLTLKQPGGIGTAL